jgi:hypothetical protein
LGGQQTIATSSTEGKFFIDLIDAKKKELVWEGEGGRLSYSKPSRQERRIMNL